MQPFAPYDAHLKVGPAGVSPARPSRGQEARVTFPMSGTEELFILDLPGEPPTIQLELRVEGTLEEARLRDAIAASLAVHPMSRARLVSRRLLLRAPRWE